MQITAIECENLAREMLSAKRFHHVQCVRDAAVQLAKQFGADVHKAEIAALLHDITKELPPQENLRWLERGGIIYAMGGPIAEKLWHAYTGALYAREELGVEDGEILDAIFYHTTGRANMTLLDKIIYVADKTSAERTYDGVELLREPLRAGKLDEAVYKTLLRLDESLRAKGGMSHVDTRAAIAQLGSALT